MREAGDRPRNEAISVLTEDHAGAGALFHSLLKQGNRSSSMMLRLSAFALVLFLALTGDARAQESPETRTEFWPEIQAFIKLEPKWRIFLNGRVSRSLEDGEVPPGQPYEALIGAHLDYLPNQHFILRGGYRYITSLNQSDPHEVLNAHCEASTFNRDDDFIFVRWDGRSNDQDRLRNVVLYPALERRRHQARADARMVSTCSGTQQAASCTN
jgi:hypothetical protein